MEASDDQQQGPPPPLTSERDLLPLFRIVAIVTCTALIIFTVAIDNLGRLFVRPDFHVSELLFYALIGSWLALLGIPAGSALLDRIRGNGR